MTPASLVTPGCLGEWILGGGTSLANRDALREDEPGRVPAAGLRSG